MPLPKYPFELSEWSSATVANSQGVKPKTAYTPKLLIDIEAKLQKAHSPGFEHYARIYNLKEMARTLIFLHDSGIGTYEELNRKIKTMDNEHDGKSARIKEIETRQKETTELQRNIGTYNKTKDTFNEWRKLKIYQQTKWEKFRKTLHPVDVFYEANRADVTLCQAAKKYFDAHGYGKDKKIPSIQSLKEEYAILDKEKRGLYNRFTRILAWFFLVRTRNNVVCLTFDCCFDIY